MSGPKVASLPYCHPCQTKASLVSTLISNRTLKVNRIAPQQTRLGQGQQYRCLYDPGLNSNAVPEHVQLYQYTASYNKHDCHDLPEVRSTRKSNKKRASTYCSRQRRRMPVIPTAEKTTSLTYEGQLPCDAT